MCSVFYVFSFSYFWASIYLFVFNKNLLLLNLSAAAQVENYILKFCWQKEIEDYSSGHAICKFGFPSYITGLTFNYVVFVFVVWFNKNNTKIVILHLLLDLV